MFFKVIEMLDAVEIDERASFSRLDEFLCGRVVRTEYYLLARDPGSIREQQFRKRRAIGTASFLSHDGENGRIRECLHCEVLLEALVPRKCLEKPACLPSDALFVIYIEWRRVLSGEFFDAVSAEWRCFGHNELRFHVRPGGLSTSSLVARSHILYDGANRFFDCLAVSEGRDAHVSLAILAKTHARCRDDVRPLE